MMIDATDRILIRTYTLREIDTQLEVISNIIKFGKKRNKSDCFAQADTWLDRRLDLVKGGNK